MNINVSKIQPNETKWKSYNLTKHLNCLCIENAPWRLFQCEQLDASLQRCNVEICLHRGRSYLHIRHLGAIAPRFHNPILRENIDLTRWRVEGRKHDCNKPTNEDHCRSFRRINTLKNSRIRYTQRYLGWREHSLHWLASLWIELTGSYYTENEPSWDLESRSGCYDLHNGLERKNCLNQMEPAS